MKQNLTQNIQIFSSVIAYDIDKVKFNDHIFS